MKMPEGYKKIQQHISALHSSTLTEPITTKQLSRTLFFLKEMAESIEILTTTGPAITHGLGLNQREKKCFEALQKFKEWE